MVCSGSGGHDGKGCEAAFVVVSKVKGVQSVGLPGAGVQWGKGIIKDGDNVFVEGNDAVGVANLSNREQGMTCEAREYMAESGSGGQQRQRKHSRVGGLDRVAIGKADGKGCCGGAQTGMGGSGLDVVTCGSTINNGSSSRRGTRMGRAGRQRSSMVTLKRWASTLCCYRGINYR